MPHSLERSHCVGHIVATGSTSGQGAPGRPFGSRDPRDALHPNEPDLTSRGCETITEENQAANGAIFGRTIPGRSSPSLPFHPAIPANLPVIDQQNKRFARRRCIRVRSQVAG